MLVMVVMVRRVVVELVSMVGVLEVFMGVVMVTGESVENGNILVEIRVM
jgi:hypothetical protein